MLMTLAPLSADQTMPSVMSEMKPLPVSIEHFGVDERHVVTDTSDADAIVVAAATVPATWVP